MTIWRTDCNLSSIIVHWSTIYGDRNLKPFLVTNYESRWPFIEICLFVNPILLAIWTFTQKVTWYYMLAFWLTSKIALDSCRHDPNNCQRTLKEKNKTSSQEKIERRKLDVSWIFTKLLMGCYYMSFRSAAPNKLQLVSTHYQLLKGNLKGSSSYSKFKPAIVKYLRNVWPHHTFGSHPTS
jgi:hypothetical protein